MTVLSPWRALERNDLTVTHWHGDVTLGTPFPSRFYHGGADLLSGPVRFLVTLSSPGGEQEISATPTLSSEADDEVTWTFAWTGNGVSASGTIGLHETGMVTCSVTLLPVSTKHFTSIKLELPLNPNICEFLRESSPKGYSVVESPAPTWTDGSFSRSYPTSGARPSDRWSRIVSVANDNLGLQWCFESDANHKSPTITVNQSTGLATIAVVTSDQPMSTAFSYEFTLSPLPCRPLVSDWVLSSRVGRVASTDTERNRFTILSEDKSPFITFHGSLNPSCNPTEYAEHLAEWRDAGLKVAGYMSSQYWLDDVDNDYDDDWTNHDEEGHFGGSGSEIYKRCGDDDEPSKAFQKIKFWLEDFQEYFLARIDSQFSANNFDALYFDVHDTQAASSFTDDFSRSNIVQMPFSLHRHWCKTLYGRCEGTGRSMLIHPQYRFNARCHAYAHYVVVGEELSTAAVNGEFPTLQQYSPAQHLLDPVATPDDATRRRYYMKTLPIRYWRRVANSRVTGVAVVFLPELWRKGVDGFRDLDTPFPTENLVAMCRLHGVNAWRSFCYTPVLDNLYAAEDNFGITSNSRFYGYWQSNCPATTADPDAKVSVYREGNKLLVYVVNFADTDRGIDIVVPGATDSPVARSIGSGTGDGHRSTPFTTGPTGTNGAYTVYVARENFASVEITLSETAAPRAAYHLRRQRCCR